MTCIVGVVDDGKVYIGGDSAGVAGYSIVTRVDSKVFKNGPYIMGFTSSFRMGDILKHDFKAPKPRVGMKLDKFMVKEFIPAIRKAFKEGGYSKNDNGKEQGGTFLVGIYGHLFHIGGDFQVGESLDGYDSVGCGEDLALGSLFSTAASDMTAEERVTHALQAAEKFSAGVSGPFNIKVAKPIKPVQE